MGYVAGRVTLTCEENYPDPQIRPTDPIRPTGCHFENSFNFIFVPHGDMWLTVVGVDSVGVSDVDVNICRFGGDFSFEHDTKDVSARGRPSGSKRRF